jgi:MFS family permease
VPILPGFVNHFGFSNDSAGQLRYFVSIVFAGAGVGALLSLFINDLIGRLWSWRLYVTIWVVGQLTMCFTPTLAGLWVARVICGFGIGPLTVIGTMAIVEIAPKETRGLLAVWFSVAMCISSVCAVFTVLGSYIHIATSRLQYQVVWFSPCVFFALLMVGSFFLCESPRWLWLVGRHEEAVATLVKLRGLPADHPRVQQEILEIQEAVQKEMETYGDGTSRMMGNFKELFTVSSNLRRLQQTLVSFALAQLSGANSITSYFIPILRLLGQAGGTTHSLFLSGMYSTSKVFFTLIASFFLIDALGRRGSLFAGAALQMVSDIYLSVYLKYEQADNVNATMSQAAIGMLFIHALGYAIGSYTPATRPHRIVMFLTLFQGLFVLPYVFGGELWPNRIRSFGGAISQCFHCK